ncbi:MAG TPA: hypothetical protein VE398_10450 [Acidobacteriota bacterium]|nr:hypothetical protein [Acidobacteriota bacterium]
MKRNIVWRVFFATPLQPRAAVASAQDHRCPNRGLTRARRMNAMVTLHRRLLDVIAVLCLFPALATATGVHPRFDLTSPHGGPFPSDRFTVLDLDQATLRRANLPKPDCAALPSECADIDVINTLDGFNLQPRLAIPFDAAIDVASVDSSSMFLLRLGSTLPETNPGSARVGINQVVWDPATKTLFAESDEFLDEHTVYGLVVTRAVRDAAGDPVEASEAFLRFRHDLNFGQTHDAVLHDYRKALLLLLAEARQAGVPEQEIAVASVFTTQSATAMLLKIQRQIKESPPPAADFYLGPGGVRTVFPIEVLTSLEFKRQVATSPGFTSTQIPLSNLGIVPGTVGKVAFGRFLSPDYETAEKYIPAVGTLDGTLLVQATVPVYFNLILPAGMPPPGGWPVALFGHAFTDNKNNTPFAVAATLAANGFATAAINVVGHGGGPLGTLTALPAGGAPVTFPAGGRGIDQDGNGTIDVTEGVSAAPPRAIIGNRDGLRQTVVDLMAFVRAIEGGVDADGDGSMDLDPARIYYLGQSFGGIYGTMFMAVEPHVRAGVLNVAGGPIVDVSRLGSFRPLLGQTLSKRTPSLINVSGITFNENLPLRNQPALVNDVTGAIAIQDYIDNQEWVQQAGNPVAYAPHIRRDPFYGMAPKPVIFQFAKGDKTVANPATTAVLRAGDLADTATFYRNDLAFLANSAVPKDPHMFLTRITMPSMAAVAFAAQLQIVTFFASDGTVVIDPDGAGALFEFPFILPLPEELNFIP